MFLPATMASSKLIVQTLLLLAVFRSASGCLCPPPFPGTGDFFQAAYHAASVVVKAKVIRERPLPSPTCTPPCLGPPFLEGRRTYELRLIRSFKGEKPSRSFTVETELNAVRCGITLQVGEVYMLNTSGSGSKFFVWLCQYNRLWSSLSRKERRFLWRCAPGASGKIKLCGKPSGSPILLG